MRTCIVLLLSSIFLTACKMEDVPEKRSQTAVQDLTVSKYRDYIVLEGDNIFDWRMVTFWARRMQIDENGEYYLTINVIGKYHQNALYYQMPKDKAYIFLNFRAAQRAWMTLSPGKHPKLKDAIMLHQDKTDVYCLKVPR